MKKKTKKRDLLKDLYNGKITEDEAYDLYDEALEFTKGWEREELFRLSRIETTADAHGTPLAVIAKWRIEGWPEHCPICHKKIVPEKFGWLVREIKKDEYCPVHIDCLDNTE